MEVDSTDAGKAAKRKPESNGDELSAKRPKTESVDSTAKAEIKEESASDAAQFWTFDSADRIANIEQKIKLAWHYDQEQCGARNRMQAFFAFQSEFEQASEPVTSAAAPSDDGLARATVFIENSQLHIDVFHAYYRVFFVNVQSKYSWDTDACPVWFHRFSLAEFNRRLQLLKQTTSDSSGSSSSNAGSSASDTKSARDESAQIREWCALLTPSQIAALPASGFRLLVARFRNNDLCLFSPRMLHAILDAKGATLVRVKLYMHVHSHNPSTKRPDQTVSSTDCASAR